MILRIGQGNGLAGTLRVLTLSGGTFRVGSQRGRLTVSADGDHVVDGKPAFRGTMITSTIRMASELRIEEALRFAGRAVEHLNILDYHDEEGEAMVLRLEKETRGVGSRPSWCVRSREVPPPP